MSSPYPPPSMPPPYPAGGVTVPPPHLRGRRPIQVGIVLLCAGLVVLIVGIVVLATQSLSKVNDFQRVAVADRAGTITFDKSGGYVAYYESASFDSDDRTVPLVGVLLKSPSGKVISVRTPYGNRSDGKIKSLSYDYDGHKGTAMYQFHISETGTYQVALTPTPLVATDAKVAFGKSIAAGTAVGALVTVLGVALMIAGLITLIVGLVKRSRHKKQLAAYYGGMPAPPLPGQQQQWPAQQQWPGQQGQWPAQQQQWPGQQGQWPGQQGQWPAEQQWPGQPQQQQQPWPAEPSPWAKPADQGDQPTEGPR